MRGAAHIRLEAATRADHRRLEHRVDIVERVRSQSGRVELVAGFYRLHGEIEAAIQPWLAGTRALDFTSRIRTPRLAADLCALGVEPPALAPGVVRAESAPEALGLMYVLEGSALGGRVIRRQVEDLTGLGFLDPYGAATGERWRAFLAVLEVEARTAEAREAAAAGAVAGFRHAERRLCEGLAHV